MMLAERGVSRGPQPKSEAHHSRRTTAPQRLLRWLWDPPITKTKAIILIRLMAGGVFLWEGILKFVYHNQGGGRFGLIGIPYPEASATFTGVLEIVGGILLICGLFTRLITIPFIIEMLVAMLSTKITMYLGTSPLPLPPAPPKTGPWAVLHEIRSEYAQLMSVVFLLIAGPGPWSLDALLANRRARAAGPVGTAGDGQLEYRAQDPG